MLFRYACKVSGAVKTRSRTSIGSESDQYTAGFRRVREVTEMFLSLAFKRLNFERYESHAYRAEQTLD